MRVSTWSATILISGTVCATLLACGDDDDRADFFTRTDLVSSLEGRAPTFDPNLVDPWGVTSGPETFLWVVNRGTGTATVYNEDGQRVFLQEGGQVATEFVVQIPAAPATSRPTDIVYNGTGAFEVSVGDDSGASEFLIATEDGTIAAWTEDLVLDAALILDSAGTSAFTGLAVPIRSTDVRLYAVDFLGGRVLVFDEDLEPEDDLTAEAFVDPSLPADMVPFGIATIDGDIYVSYVRRGPEGPAPGSGAVAVFNTDGELQWRLDSAFLDAPYAMVDAPDDFGPFKDAVLVGNTGDGTIQAFETETGKHLGPLTGPSGQQLVINGLRDLHFGLDTGPTDGDELFFTATLDEGNAGLFGRIQQASTVDL